MYESEQPFEWVLDTHHLRLAPPELVAEAHKSDPLPFLAPQISSTAELQYSDISREVEVAYAMDNFSHGLADDPRFGIDRQHRIRWSKGADTSFPGVVLCQPKVTTIGSAIVDKPTLGVQRGSVTYVAAGAKLYQVTTSAVTLDTTFAANITALRVWGGNLIVGLGSSTNFQYRASDTSGGAFTGGGRAAHFIAASGDQLYTAISPTTLAVADNVAGSWATYDVGSSSYAITSLVALDNLIIVGKEDGPYAFDSDLVALSVVPELEIQADAQVCKAAIAFNRDYIATTRWSIVRVRPGEGIKYIGLDLLADPALPGTPPEPRPTSFTTDGRFLYAIVISGNGLYVWKLDLAGNWHSYLYRTDLGAAADLLFATGKIGSTSKNAVIFAYQSAGNWQLAYAQFPRTADPTKDTDYQYETAVTSSLRVLDYTGSLLTIEKYAERQKIVADDLSSTRKITTYIYVDNEARKKLDEFLSSKAFEEKTLPEAENFHRASLEIELAAEAATSPKLRGFHLSAAFLGRVVRRHTCHFLAVSEVAMATGGRQHPKSDHRKIVSTLRELRRTRAAVTCKDEYQREFVAYIKDVHERTVRRKVAEGRGYTPVRLLIVVLDEVASDTELEQAA